MVLSTSAAFAGLRGPARPSQPAGGIVHIYLGYLIDLGSLLTWAVSFSLSISLFSLSISLFSLSISLFSLSISLFSLSISLFSLSISLSSLAITSEIVRLWVFSLPL